MPKWNFTMLGNTAALGHPLAICALVLFGLAYALVVLEDVIHLKKSKPVILAAGLIWVLTALVMGEIPGIDLEASVGHHVKDFAELFLFLTVAMTYVHVISEHNVFLKLNAWLVSIGLGLRAVFWATGALAFVLSPVADNLTTALLMGAVVAQVGRGNQRFVALACTNVVVAANAGGAFSPFGDITTLMVWQAGMVQTSEFGRLFVPALVNWLVPAAFMAWAIPNDPPQRLREDVRLVAGWQVVIALFLLTIATAVLFHAQLHLPPFLGMMLGLSYLMFYGYARQWAAHRDRSRQPLDVLGSVAAVEWDTLLFFFGVIMCVGGLSELGYLGAASTYLYGELGPTVANIGVGVISAVLDNVPVMFAVLGMNPEMGQGAEAHYQWLLVTLTAGVGGSLLSVGSAAGVALMGASGGAYTFGSHLRCLPVIALGYAAAILAHWLLNAPAEIALPLTE